MKGYFKTLVKKSILAGLLIGIASCVYVLCENKIVGALLFSVGLISVLVLEANLFTGKVGYIDSKDKFFDSLVILALNIATAFIVGTLLKVVTQTEYAVSTRFENIVWYNVLFKGIITGALIYLAVELYKKTNSLIPVILCVMAFILSGSYHCIADAAYLGMSNVTWESIAYLSLVIVGNSIGSLLIRVLQVNLFEKKSVS